MARLKKEVTHKPIEDVSAPVMEDTVVEEVVEEKVSNKEVAVLSKVGTVIRKYSAKVHGSDFEELAQEFATKIGGSVK